MTLVDDERHPVWRLLDRMQMDMRQMNARMVELRAEVVGLQLGLRPAPPPAKCGDCQMTYRTIAELQEHRYHHHAGPLPDSWVAADRLVGADACT